MKHFNNYIQKAFTLILAVSFLVSCSDYEPEIKTSEGTVEIDANLVLQNRGYNIFLDAVAHAGIGAEVFGGDTVTIFAPTNSAFNNLLASVNLTSVTELDAAVLADILRYHVAAGAYTSSMLPTSLPSALAGKNIQLVTGSDGVISVNGKAGIVDANLISNDAIIHGINTVLTAPTGNLFATLSADAKFSTLVSALQRVGLDAAISGSTAYTVLAPNNDAFTALGVDLATLTDAQLTNILSFHVIAGRVYSTQLPEAGTKVASILGDESTNQQELVLTDAAEFNGVSVVSANIGADNGVIHEVGAVVQEMATITDAFGTGVDVSAGNDGILTDLFGGVVSSTGYTGFADISKTFTVYSQLFGPSDVSAFADAAAATTYIENRTFEGRVMARSMSNGDVVTAINGARYFVVQTASGATYINGLARSAFGATSATNSESFVDLYNGSLVYPFNGGSFTPLPTTNIFEMLDAVDTVTLISEALRVTGRDVVLASGNHTFFAVGDTAFAQSTGLKTVADITALSESGLAGLGAALDAHIVPNDVQFSIVITTDLPTLTNAAGDEIFFSEVDGNAVIIGDTKDVTNTTTNILGVDVRASNGVIHLLDGVL